MGFVEGKFSLLIPCHKLFPREIDSKYELEACIDSILDQDYPNYEIVLGINGPDANSILTWAVDKYGDRLKYVVCDEANAANARNKAATIADGEFRSYFSSDLTMYPGTLSIWKKAFDDNPDAAIIYSEGIDWVKGGRPLDFRAMVGPYDPYEMTCHNFIDGANPVRAKYDQPWDPEVKALQDWNWALKVLKPCTPEEKKAVMIPDVCYTTEEPKAGGLSHYFSEHWEELNDQIKGLRGIPKRNIVVSSLGAPSHGLRTARLLGADFLQMPSQHPHDYDVVYLLGYYLSNQNGHNQVFQGMRRNAVRIIHWIGTDILQLMHQPWIVEKQMAAALTEYIDIHLCECEATRLELAELGIEAEVLPLPLDAKAYPFYEERPEQYTVAVYAPQWDVETARKYNLPLMVDIARSMPDFKFIFFGTRDTAPELSDNCEVRGWVDIRDVAKDSSGILRFPYHDGLPISPIEFLMMGRDALVTMPVHGTYPLGSGMLDISSSGADYEMAKSRIIKQLRHIAKNPISMDKRKEYAEYWKVETSPDTFKQKFNQLWINRQMIVNVALETKWRKDKENV